MRKGIIFTLVLILVALMGGGYYFRHPIWEMLTHEEADTLKQVRELLDEGKPRQALAKLGYYAYQLNQDSAIAKQWRSLYLEAAIKSKSSESVLLVYDRYPNILDDNEEGTLLAADLLIKSNRPTDYARLREGWKGRESAEKESVWFNLDADKLLLEGNRTGAADLLNAHTFEGKADTGRLIRLALLNVKESPKKTWEYLAQAYAKDPENPEIRSYRARLLEVVGQTGLALNEYLAAVQANPKNIFYQDQLAEFYRRQNRYDLAINVWKGSLAEPESGSLWLKAWFWSHVIAPMDIDWTNVKPPEGPLQPFLTYLSELPSGTFWNEAAFKKLPNAENYLHTQQATFWLRLLDACQHHNENGAWELLQYNFFAQQSWNPDLENLLKKILTYRKIGTFSIEVPGIASAPPAEGQKTGTKIIPTHPLYTEITQLSTKDLNSTAISPELNALLHSDLAISSPFLVLGWLEAALDLAPEPIKINADMPEWVAYDYALAIRAVKGLQPALQFAEKQTQTPSISMLIGELLIAKGQTDEGVEKLRQLSGLDSEIGFRSAWLLSLVYIEKKQYDQADAVINSQPRLLNDTLGQETLARIALLQGKPEEAEKKYLALQDKSWEAKSFLARKAFQDKDYQKAKELTEELLRQFPSNALLRQNYKLILEETKQDNTAAHE